MVRSTVLAAVAATLLARTAQATYSLDTLYDASNFFQSFDHYSGADPTRGYVEYVDQQTGQSSGLSGIHNGAIYMGVDATTKNPPNGRRSIRVESQQTFNRGLFVADIAHMPTNKCGVWPAFWTYGPNWPTSGEIDIIEGVNTQSTNQATLHTGNNCLMSSFAAEPGTTVIEDRCGNPNGCGQLTRDNQNYGDGFNAIGGGIYAMEWNAWHINVWFFPRSKIPADIHNERPDPLLWGKPSASFAGGLTCDVDATFKDHKIVFDTTFCGDWAGNAWSQNSECTAHAATCKDYVAANPADFKDAYWLINSLKVYKLNFL